MQMYLQTHAHHLTWSQAGIAYLLQQKFEELFTKYDKDGKGGLTLKELFALTENIRKIMDPVGWSAAKFEWGATYYIAHNGVRIISMTYVPIRAA